MSEKNEDMCSSLSCSGLTNERVVFSGDLAVRLAAFRVPLAGPGFFLEDE